MTNFSSWQEDPLRPDDMIAGFVLLFLGIVFILLYSLVAYFMYSHDKDIVGFRFLFSASIADILLLFNYTIWPAFTILFKSELITTDMRHWVQMYLDWVWFSMCYHYMVIAWSRFAAIRYPSSFRIQSRTFSYTLCLACYVAAMIQVLCTHFQEWYVTFYYEPSHYGMLSEDFEKYLNEGQSLFFATFHFLMIIIPAFFYGTALFLLLKQRKNGLIGQTFTKPVSTQSRTEARLIIPCIFNSIVFIIGQIVITIGTGEGKWATWTVMLLFSMNSAVNPVLLLMFSNIIREKFKQLFIKHKPPLSRLYSTVRARKETSSTRCVMDNISSGEPSNDDRIIDHSYL
ncbi:unnamed protein product [Bursaphelenchus xylophilus]|nr:unnamed protein product [Bursaphelenchus xylophilus]CAG9123411.1 unnamed protein product [Bursaphelenchus xylophilus]